MKNSQSKLFTGIVLLIIAIVIFCYVACVRTSGSGRLGLYQTIIQPSTLSTDNFGTSVSCLDSVFIVGAPNRKVGTKNKQGSAFLYVNGSFVQELVDSNGDLLDYFGNSSFITKDYYVVGAYGDNIGTLNDAGSVIVFDRSSLTQSKLLPSNPQAYAYFGSSVCADSNYVVVGAPKYNTAKGIVYLFKKDLTWSEHLTLTSPANQNGEQFGASVFIKDSLIFVGAWGNSSNRGCVYVYNTSGVLLKTVTASDRASGDAFGTSICVDGDNLFVGSPNDDSYKGSVYRFSGSTNWGSQLKLTASDKSTNSRFGCSVYSKGTIIVGARGSSNSSNYGAFYTYDSSFANEVKTQLPSPTLGDMFGCSVCTNGTLNICGGSGYQTNKGVAMTTN